MSLNMKVGVSSREMNAKISDGGQIFISERIVKPCAIENRLLTNMQNAFA